MPRPKRKSSSPGIAKPRLDCPACTRSFVYAGALSNHFTKAHSPSLSSTRKSRAERAAALEADTANAQHCPLLRLPSDVLVLIMKSLDDFVDLKGLLLTARMFSRLFRQAEKGVCGAIARRKFPREAIELLNFWRPGGLSSFQRQFIIANAPVQTGVQSLVGGGARWIRARLDQHLDRSTEIIGIQEVQRLKHDASLVKGAVDEWLELQEERYNDAQAAVQFVTPLRRWFDRPAPLVISPSARHRVELAMYRIMLLARDFYPRTETSPPSGIWDVTSHRFDYTSLRLLPLRDLFHLFYVVDSSEIALAPFRDSLDLDHFLHDRCMDSNKLKDCPGKLTEYLNELKDVKLKGIWDWYQPALEKLVEKIEGGGGYPGGLNLLCYKREVVDVPVGEEGTEKREVLRMRTQHLRFRAEWEFEE